VTLIPDNTGTDLDVARNFLQLPLSKIFKHVLTYKNYSWHISILNTELGRIMCLEKKIRHCLGSKKTAKPICSFFICL